MAKAPIHRRRLGENIRAARRGVGLTQEELAERADLHHNYIGDIERGEENVSIDALVRVATALKVTVADLVHHIEARR